MHGLQVLHNKAARLILNLARFSSASDVLKKLFWRPLQRRRAEHRAVFTYKSINNLFVNTFSCNFNRNFHCHNTRNRNDIRKSSARRRWAHWTTPNCSSDIWNSLELALRESPTLTVFKQSFYSDLPDHLN